MWHKSEAERLLKLAWKKDADGSMHYADSEIRREIIEKARVHAMLAQEPGYLVREEP